MKCPVCSNVDLLMTERQSIEIDYCPNCRGVWLDRGELDKMIERSANVRYYDDDDDDHYKQSGYSGQNQPYGQQQQYPPKKKKGFLGDMFDIFD